MTEPETTPTYVDLRGIELLQLAALAGEFYEALADLKLPESVVHQLLVSWFENELDNGAVVIDDE